jgi:hypothetical protein
MTADLAADGLAAWHAQVRAAGWCARPVRLSGRTSVADTDTGELTVTLDSATQPGGVVLKACGCRRESVCTTCAAVYRADAWQLVAAGLRGGKGVPESVAEHPAVFATFTAPSFGPVHTRRSNGGAVQPCHREAGVCQHGTTRACPARHDQGDERLGEPICPSCFDYEGAVLWNATVTELWRRTTIYIFRRLAQACGLTVAGLRQRVRVSYSKVVEYQRRGVVHVHAVIRLDGGHGGPPPEQVTVEVLTGAVIAAAGTVAAPVPGGGVAGWGAQIDVQPIGVRVGSGAVAAYVAKYATKSTDAFGRLDHRLTATDVVRLDVRPHLKAMVTAAWELGGCPELAGLRLRPWAHTLGFRGHWLTKSRGYSTTFGALRTARGRWQADQHDEPAIEDVAVMKGWRYAGRGYTTPPDMWPTDTTQRQEGVA